ncbi:MAG: CIA30 family protein, partial [Gammaproteobacteria bacterium]
AIGMTNRVHGDWVVVVDGVMGGRSSGEAAETTEGLVFSGTLSLENNGGFSSIRRNLDGPPEGRSGVRLWLRGDGRSYQFRLRPNRDGDGVAWRAPFATNGAWQEIEVGFDAFEPVFRGRAVPQAGAIDPGEIGQIGFMIADRQPGPFTLEVRRIEFY